MHFCFFKSHQLISGSDRTEVHLAKESRKSTIFDRKFVSRGLMKTGGFFRQSSILDMDVLNILYHIRICTHLYFSYFYIFLIQTSMIFFPFLRFLSFHLLYFFLKFSLSLLAVMERNSTACVLVFHTIKKKFTHHMRHRSKFCQIISEVS